MFYLRSLVLLLVVLTTSNAELFLPVSVVGCGTIKGCLFPPICTDSYCEFMTTWKLVTHNAEDYVEFELKGKLNDPGGFLSLAFSEDKKISTAGVVGCYHHAATGAVRARAGYNSGKMNTFYTGPDTELLISEGDNLGGTYNPADKVLQCRFRRRVRPRDMVLQLKDLSEPNAYYLTITRGNDVLPSGFSRPFAGGEATYDNSVLITSPIYGSMTVISEQGSALMKTHGCLMVLAWVLCASIGVILARYYKELWPNSGLLGERVWFQSHRILQSSCVILTCIAIILAFIYCEGYSRVSTFPHYVHPILGLIVFCLALLNPLITFCRCKVDHPDRPWFNWIHFFIGTFAHVLSVPTMMLGLRMPAAGFQLQFLNYPLWILIFFVIFQFCIELILEIHGCMYYNRNKNKRREYTRELTQYHAGVRTALGPRSKPPEPEPSGRMFKYFIIGLHSTVCAIVAIILVITIAVN
ncbi:DOMON domain-containing protein frrs1L [Clonorchis sinensis]|uniref:DOMON domain-containing protein frrs1L n=1 Tax=Clonorchis sinensis TaxID=79923 RepID=A0A3R7FXV9_CLOSI|nr:DOMON domain-containing protein frrs1L [Clonorchis sinensis]